MTVHFDPDTHIQTAVVPLAVLNRVSSLVFGPRTNLAGMDRKSWIPAAVLVRAERRAGRVAVLAVAGVVALDAMAG